MTKNEITAVAMIKNAGASSSPVRSTSQAATRGSNRRSSRESHCSRARPPCSEREAGPTQKRSVAEWPKLPRPSSTLPKPTLASMYRRGVWSITSSASRDQVPLLLGKHHSNLISARPVNARRVLPWDEARFVSVVALTPSNWREQHRRSRLSSSRTAASFRDAEEFQFAFALDWYIANRFSITVFRNRLPRFGA
jgi:hypothetical protein